MNRRKIVLLGLLAATGLLAVYSDTAAAFLLGTHQEQGVLLADGSLICPDGMVPTSPNLRLDKAPEGYLAYALPWSGDISTCIGLVASKPPSLSLEE